MTTREALKHYRIKPPHSLGKVIYVQSFDVKKEIVSHLLAYRTASFLQSWVFYFDDYAMIS